MNALHLLGRQRPVAPEQALEGDVEGAEGRDLAEGAAVGLDVGALALAVAIAAPVHRPMVGQAAQGSGWSSAPCSGGTGPGSRRTRP